MTLTIAVVILFHCQGLHTTLHYTTQLRGLREEAIGPSQGLHYTGQHNALYSHAANDIRTRGPAS